MSRVKLVFEPLLDWPYPQTTRVGSPFKATWTSTRELLEREADLLGANLMVIELDLDRADLRQDGQIRASARLRSGRVRVSLDSRHGSLRYAADRYDAGTRSWQANLRAIALTMEALRAVNRWGAVHSAEQYQGFLAIPAGPPETFHTADEALAWLAGVCDLPVDTPPRKLLRQAAAVLHPDRTNGDRTGWDRLEAARDLIESETRQ